MARKLASNVSMRVLFILLAFISLEVSAQKIEFGENFNNVGALKKPGTEWTTNEWPRVLSIMYTNGKTTINGNAMNILVKSTTNGVETTDSVKLVIGQARNWAGLRYDFTAENTYTVSAYDRVWTFLASGTVKVNGPKKPEPKPVVKVEIPAEKVAVKKAKLTKEELVENAPDPVFVESVVIEELTEEEKETLVFESFYIAFGRAVKSGMLTGQNEKFKGMPGGVNLKALFSNNEGFGTEGIDVDIWFKPQGTKEYNEHFTNLHVPIAKGVTQADFPINVRDRGSYKVSLYTSDEDAIWIGSGYLSIY
tara:strand:+ start:565 stop:1488 length:924 start_codon:yes stop_codon:yes gene_type:complete